MTSIEIPTDDLPEVFGTDPIPDDIVPEGYYRDPESKRLVKNGEEPPRVSRPKDSPSIDDLKATPKISVEERAPKAKQRQRKAEDIIPPELPPLPPYRVGVITRGMNKIYRRAGKIAKAFDGDVGEALIACAINTSEDGDPDDSVGAAWDELAKVNPRVRRVLLKMLQGGVYGQLVMAHLPIVVAILAKDAVRNRIPFTKLIEAATETDSESPNGMLAGLRPEDLQAMAAQMGPLMQQMGMVPPQQTASPGNSRGDAPSGNVRNASKRATPRQSRTES